MTRQARRRRSSATLSLGLALVGVFGIGCSGAPTPSAASPSASDPSAPAPTAPDEVWREQQPTAGAPRAFDYPPAQMSRLPNGITLYLVPRKAGTVALSVSSRAGGASCAPGQSGLAALTLRLMTEATSTKAGLQLAEAVENLGANLEFDTGRDGSSVSLEVLPSDVQAGLALLAEVVTQPRFAAEDVERIKRQWLDSLVSERQEPSRLSTLAGMRAVLGPKIGAPVRGSLRDVRELSRKDLVRFHRQQYVAGNLAVLAVGDLTMAQLTELAGAGFGRLPAAPPPPLPPLELPAAPGQTSVWLVDRPGSVQSAVFVGQPFPERAAPGHEARQVMNNLLGGLFTSRLNLNLRETHAYTYGVRSLDVATRRWGAFITLTSVKTEATADALEQTIVELRGLRSGSPKPISAEELQRSSTDLVHQLGANLEHVRRILGDTGELYVDGLAPDYHNRYASLIAQVDEAAVRREAERLTPDRLTVVIVGDRQQIEPLLIAKGWSPRLAPEPMTE